jgi:hypothetical protein
MFSVVCLSGPNQLFTQDFTREKLATSRKQLADKDLRLGLWLDSQNPLCDTPDLDAPLWGWHSVKAMGPFNTSFDSRFSHGNRGLQQKAGGES